MVPKAKRDILFRRLNLMTRPLPFRHPLDVVFCRNVVIYFEGEDRRRVIQSHVDQLAPGGLYFIGRAETLPPEVTGLERTAPSAFVKVA